MKSLLPFIFFAICNSTAIPPKSIVRITTIKHENETCGLTNREQLLTGAAVVSTAAAIVLGSTYLASESPKTKEQPHTIHNPIRFAERPIKPKKIHEYPNCDCMNIERPFAKNTEKDTKLDIKNTEIEEIDTEDEKETLDELSKDTDTQETSLLKKKLKQTRKRIEMLKKEAIVQRSHYITMGSAFAKEYSKNQDYVIQDILARADARRKEK